MQPVVRENFDLWRSFLAAQTDTFILPTRKWAVDLHEACVVFLEHIEPHIPGFKEVELHYEEPSPSARVSIKIGMIDDSIVPFESIALKLQQSSAPALARIAELMRQQPEEVFIGHMASQLATAMEVFGVPDTDRWIGVFHSQTTQLKAEAMLGVDYPHWLALDEKSKMEQITTPAPKQSSGPSRRM